MTLENKDKLVRLSSLELLIKKINEEIVSTAGEKNVIESISVNGIDQAVNNKKVNIAVPTKVSDLDNDKGFQTAFNVANAEDVVAAWNDAFNGSATQ